MKIDKTVGTMAFRTRSGRFIKTAIALGYIDADGWRPPIHLYPGSRRVAAMYWLAEAERVVAAVRVRVS